MNVTMRKIGNSEGVILPKEVLDRSTCKAGDSLKSSRQADGITLEPMDDELRAADEGRSRGHGQVQGRASEARRMSWEFLTRRAVEAMHAEQLRRHGGAAGLRDENVLESALGRPQNKAAYGEPISR